MGMLVWACWPETNRSTSRSFFNVGNGYSESKNGNGHTLNGKDGKGFCLPRSQPQCRCCLAWQVEPITRRTCPPTTCPRRFIGNYTRTTRVPAIGTSPNPRVVEITPTPDNSAEAQAAIFSGAGVEHNPGARYGYRTDNDSKQAAFPTPLTEEQMASCDLLVEHLASCADQLGLDAAAVESLVNLRESITDPDEYQAVVDVIREIGCSLLRHAYQSMDEDITGTSNGNGQKRRKQQADMENDEDEDEVNSDIGRRVAKAALTKPLKGAR